MLGDTAVSVVLIVTLFATVALAALPPVRREITPVAVRPPTGLDRLAGPVSTLRAEGQREHGQPIGERTTLHAGESIVVTAQGFRPGEQVCIRLAAPGHRAGEDCADDSGIVRFVYRIPADLPGGQHHIIINESRSANLTNQHTEIWHRTSHQGSNATALKARFAILAFVTE